MLYRLIISVVWIPICLGCLPTVPYDNTALSGPLLFSPSLAIPAASPTVPPPAAPPAALNEIIPDVENGEMAVKETPAPLREIIITMSPETIAEVNQTVLPTVDQPCPPSWSKFISTSGYKKCYKQISGDFDYLGAKFDCQSKGASLVRIETEEEYMFLKFLCITGRTLYLDNVPYIGLHRDDILGQLKWDGGSSLGFLKFYNDEEPDKREGNCFKFVTDQTISNGDLLHGGQAGFYAAVDCFHVSQSALCQIDL